MLKDYHIPPAAGGAPKHVVIFLHGVGDSGSGGLLSIGEMWNSALPNTEFLCPDAPFPFDMGPMGRQWFSLREFTPPAMLVGAKKAAPLLNEYIDHVLASRELAPDKLALVGFSQGTIMALYVAPRRAQQIAGIVGYSGVLVGGENLPREKKSSPPVLLIHGTADEVVSYALLAPSERGLKNAGIPVATLTCPGTGHTIDERGLVEGLKFLQKILI
jgi:phospholipase/carboxylesterase